MNPSELFDTWAPSGAHWSPWAKPVLFTEPEPPGGEGREEWRVASERAQEKYDLPKPGGIALVLDLAGPEALALALAGAHKGWRPVPLFNSCHGVGGVVDNAPLIVGLAKGAAELQALALATDAPPVFVLDARRMMGNPKPPCFDNRWMVFPQDLPSAALLASRGVTRAVVVQSEGLTPRADLAHVLLRWQLAGIEILCLDRAVGGEPAPIKVAEPSRFRALGQRVLALLGLRRNSAGGFGAVVPVPTQGGGGWA